MLGVSAKLEVICLGRAGASKVAFQLGRVPKPTVNSRPSSGRPPIGSIWHQTGSASDLR